MVSVVSIRYVAKQLKGNKSSEKFKTAIQVLLEFMGVDKLVKLVNDGVVKRCTDDKFLLDMINHYEGFSNEERNTFLKFFSKDGQSNRRKNLGPEAIEDAK